MRGNQASFMTKTLGKKVTPKVDLEIDFVKTFLKKTKDYIKNKETKCIKEYFYNITDNNIVTNKTLWN